MNEIVNMFLLVGSKLMPDMHLRQPGFTYGTCGLFTKSKSFLNHGFKKCLNLGLKRFLDHGSKSFLKFCSKKFLNHGSKKVP